MAAGRGAVRPRARRLGLGAAITLAGLIAGAYCTGRLWLHPRSLMVQDDWPDSVHYTWWLGWTAHALGHGLNPLVTEAMNWPDGVSAMNNTTLLLPGTLLWPLTALAGPLASLNLLNLLAVPLSALAGYWAARQLGLVRPAALAGTVCFAISPAVVNSLEGHITMAFAPGLPLLMALGVLSWRGPRRADQPDDQGQGEPEDQNEASSTHRRRQAHRAPADQPRRWPRSQPWFGPQLRIGLLLGLLAAAQLFTGEEILFQAALGSLIVLLVVAPSRPAAIPAAAGRLAVSLAAALAVFLPLAGYPLYLQFFGPLRQRGNPFLPDYYGADLTGFLTPTFRVWWRSATSVSKSATFPGGIEEHLAYLGFPLVVCCLAITLWQWRDLRVRAGAVGLLTAGLLSLGGRIWVGGIWTHTAGPYRWVQHVPVLEASLASRLGLLAALFAASLLALAVDLVWRHGLTWRGGLTWRAGSIEHGAGWPDRPAAGLPPDGDIWLAPASGAMPTRGTTPAGSLAGPSVGRPRWWAGPLPAALLAVACLVPLLPRPVRTDSPPQVPAWFRLSGVDQALPADPAPAADRAPVVLVLPFPSATKPTAMFWQAAAGYRFAMPGGYFLGPAQDGHAYVGGAPDPPTATLLQQVAAQNVAASIGAPQREQARRDFAAWGVTRIVLGPDQAVEPLRQTVSALVGAQPQLQAGVYIWTAPFGHGS